MEGRRINWRDAAAGRTGVSPIEFDDQVGPRIRVIGSMWSLGLSARPVSMSLVSAHSPHDRDAHRISNSEMHDAIVICIRTGPTVY